MVDALNAQVCIQNKGLIFRLWGVTMAESPQLLTPYKDCTI